MTIHNPNIATDSSDDEASVKREGTPSSDGGGMGNTDAVEGDSKGRDARDETVADEEAEVWPPPEQKRLPEAHPFSLPVGPRTHAARKARAAQVRCACSFPDCA